MPGGGNAGGGLGDTENCVCVSGAEGPACLGSEQEVVRNARGGCLGLASESSGTAGTRGQGVATTRPTLTPWTLVMGTWSHDAAFYVPYVCNA